MKRPGLEPQVVYTVGDLARLLGWTRFRVARLLRRKGVQTVNFGERSASLVPLVAFRAAFPEVWDSIVVKHSMPRKGCDAQCPVCGSKVPIKAVA